MSATFVSPVAAFGTGTLQNVAPVVPIPKGRFAGDGVWWVRIALGTTLRAFATGSVQRFDGVPNPVPGEVFSTCTLFELSPLPQMNPSAFKQIPGGLPVQLVMVPSGTVPPPDSDELLLAGDTIVTVPTAVPAYAGFLAFVFQDRICRDPLSWAEAIAASGACDPSWAQLIAALGALSNSRNLRVLDHRGQPLSSGTVSVQIGTSSAQTAAVVDGNTGVGVPAGSQATVTFDPASSPVVAAAGLDVGSFNAPLTLAPGARLVQVLRAGDWFAAPETDVHVEHWNANNLVEPIVEGTAYFTRLAGDMRAAKPGGAVQLAGWVFTKGSLEDSTLDWPLVPDDDTTTLLKLVTELRNDSVAMRFLVTKFLQLNQSTIDDAIWVLPLLMCAYGLFAVVAGNTKVSINPAALGIGFLGIPLITAALMSPATVQILEGIAEHSKGFLDALDTIGNDLYTWTPYPAAFSDNPIVPNQLHIGPVYFDDLDRVGVYHQKHVSIRRADGTYVAYLGGIDLNSDRIDTSLHRAVHPFHDVQLRVTGPAVKDVITSFHERLHLHQPTAVAPVPPSSVGTIPNAGTHLVQIARTYFKPGSNNLGTPLPFAPSGETTPIRTIELAIGQAKDFIYVEDQYFTPPDDYVRSAAQRRRTRRPRLVHHRTVPDRPALWLHSARRRVRSAEE